MAHSPVPVTATSKAMEMALRSVLVFMAASFAFPWVNPFRVPSGRIPALARSSGKICLAYGLHTRRMRHR
jgi:hypothetical protein